MRVLVNAPGSDGHDRYGKDTYALSVGDKVTSSFNGGDDAGVIRKIHTIKKDPSCGSGARATADGGEPCPHCGRTCRSIIDVDASWFKPIDTGSPVTPSDPVTRPRGEKT